MSELNFTSDKKDKKYEKLPSVGIYTLGCRVNQYESEAVSEIFQKSGYSISSFDSVCDVYVINTCTVTAESERKSRQFIRRAVKQNPNAVIVITGCFSQVSPEKAASIFGVDIVCGNSDKSDIPRLVSECRLKKQSSPIMCVEDIDSSPFEKMSVESSPSTRERAFVKIEDGCESKCAYCIIPKARGKVRSKLPEDVIAEVKNLAENGCKEVVLTGIETASYGIDFDKKYRLAELLTDVNKIDGIERIRLGSLDPSVMTEKFAEKISELNKLMPHFHLSMQSGCTRILNLMRRKYTADTALKNINYLRKLIPEIMFTTDIMTGFPSETDKDFEETLNFCKEAKFLGIHIFTYSKRKGTEAENMPNQVDEHVKRIRSAQLAKQNEEIKKSLINEFIKTNNTAEILFETTNGEYATGHTKNFIEAKIKSPIPLDGKILKIKNMSTDGKTISGEL